MCQSIINQQIIIKNKTQRKKRSLLPYRQMDAECVPQSTHVVDTMISHELPLSENVGSWERADCVIMCLTSR